MKNENLIRMRDVMQRLNLTYDGVYRLIMNGKIQRIYKQGRTNYFESEEIQALKQQREKDSIYPKLTA